jgi:predicted membrane-bound spermidine synthase
LSSILSNGGVSLFWNMVLLPIFGLSVISVWNLAISFWALFLLCLVIIKRASFWAYLPIVASSCIQLEIEVLGGGIGGAWRLVI